jgi:class 3 adenylate cyclase
MDGLATPAANPALSRGEIAQPKAAATNKRRRGCLSLSTVLALGLGGLMLLAVGSVLLLSVGGASRNTTALLRDKIDLTLSSIEQRVRQHLDPAATQAEYLKGLMENGTIDPNDRNALSVALRTSLAATPQVMGIAFLDASGTVRRVYRGSGELIEEDWSDRREIQGLLTEMRTGGRLSWSPPVWSEPFRQTILPVTAPVYRNGVLQGVIIPAILISELSRYVSAFSTPEQTAFILYGRNAVIAHPTLANSEGLGSPERPLPSVSEIKDSVMPSIWDVEDRLGFRLAPGDEGHVIEGPGDYYIFIYREIGGYGETPWIVGAALPGADAGREFNMLMRMAGIGVLLLLLSVISAIWVGRRISKPIRNLVAVTEGVRQLDLQNVPVLPRSRVRELDQAGQSLNSMVAALRWFELYLPKRLVHSLLARGEDQMGQVYEREVSVLFTDMRGFSQMAARLSPTETAAFLNEHFALIGTCVEAEEGTIDKYIGDSVMAFWGAPDEQPDHAERACRAALGIARAIKVDNERRRAQGLKPVSLRIGIGSGKVLVGNIGAVGRVNYTLVGDVVNIAQRLEQLGKEVDGAGEVVALITENSHSCLQNKAGATLISRRAVRDRDGEIGIYRLV